MPNGTDPQPSVQVFGLADDRATRAAQRFFKERRIAIHFVDLRRKPIASGELRRFVDRLGAAAVIDREGKAYREAGLGYLSASDADLGERMLADQRLIRLPLVRRGNDVSAGPAETTWKGWLAAGRD
jgi:arsenate reductase-like glutaredoxin family protein